MSAIGLLLVVLGAALVVAEAHVPTHGAMGSLAVAAIAAGIGLTVAGGGLGVAAGVAAGAGAALAGTVWLWLVVSKVLAARRAAVRGGAEGLVGRVGVVRAAPAPLGRVFVDGALWRARVWALEGERQLAAGDPVVVERVDGLTLTVRPAEEWEVAP